VTKPQVWQERQFLILYTQISQETKKENSTFFLQNLQPVTVFGYIYNLQMAGSWEMDTEFSQEASRVSVSSET